MRKRNFMECWRCGALNCNVWVKKGVCWNCGINLVVNQTRLTDFCQKKVKVVELVKMRVNEAKLRRALFE
ncbi:MAG: hypothetical protein KIH08_12820 [Candidatus Freyarchaeota archaeon]|nr:hypothetical protein [Candidatus Jordarchaeia archaeon]